MSIPKTIGAALKGMTIPRFVRESLRARILSGIALMLLPLVGLAACALFGINSINAGFQRVAEEVMGEMHPIMTLQVSILRAAMPGNDYLIHGEKKERDNFSRLSERVERDFDQAKAVAFGPGKERVLIRSAYEEWRQARSIAEALLALPQPAGNIAAATEVRRMDAHFDYAVSLLERVHEFTDDKAVNDVHGHVSGDKVLREAAELVRNAVRGSDQVARYGGEEFTVILPDTGKPDAHTFAQRIRAAVAAHAFLVDGADPLRVTVSVGLAEFPRDADSGEGLIAAADRALYAAKRAGRNRVRAFDRDGGMEAHQ